MKDLICFVQVESTERAIAEVNGSLVGGVQLKVTQILVYLLIANLESIYIHLFSAQVSLARRQPVIDPINDASSRFVKRACHLVLEFFCVDYSPFQLNLVDNCCLTQSEGKSQG